MKVDDPGRRADGRGAYVCTDPGCIERAVRTGSLRRTLRHEGALPAGLEEALMERAEEVEKGKHG